MRRFNPGDIFTPIASLILETIDSRVVSMRPNQAWQLLRVEHVSHLETNYTLQSFDTSGNLHRIELNESVFLKAFGESKPHPDTVPTQPDTYEFQACTDIDQGQDKRKVFTNLRHAKAFLRGACSKGFIDVKKNNGRWKRLFDYYAPEGFKRHKEYDDGPYIQWKRKSKPKTELSLKKVIDIETTDALALLRAQLDYSIQGAIRTSQVDSDYLVTFDVPGED